MLFSFHLWLLQAKYAIAACGRPNLDGAMNVLVELALSPRDPRSRSLHARGTKN